jgi:hypothetical protein
MNEKELLKLKMKKRMEQNEKTDLGRNCVMYVLRMGVLQFTALLKKKKLFFKFIVKKILLKIQCI